MLNRVPTLRFAYTTVWVGVLQFALITNARADSPSDVDFKTVIRPILSNRCFACHGPDDKKVEAGLRLDEFDFATNPAESGAVAVVPGNVSESELIRRILSTDESERMPPPHFGARLSDKEVKLLEQWIASGGTYSKHWSFDRIRPTEVAPVPSIRDFPKWQHSAVDALVFNKLSERGWTPTPEANRQTLLRRVSLDLTGLPPTLEQQDAFLQNNDENAYTELVDELLSSPAFGEHWGRKWLDLARYADSAGYADDPQRTIWAYRDWVIRAINQGKPFDEFTIEQLAGDLLSNPTDDQIIATAFHRNTLTNNEGGTNDEEFRNVAIVDRVNTTMAVWMGVTMTCAQCHNHKFDPISQKEYFQIFAILNQTEDADRGDESPVYQWYTPEQRRDREESQRSLASVEASLVAPEPALLSEQTAWAQPFKSPLVFESVKPLSVVAQSKANITQKEDGSINIDSQAETDVFTLELPIPDSTRLDQLSGLQIRSIPNAQFPNGGAGKGDGNFVLTGLSASLVPKDAMPSKGRFVRVEMQGDNKILSLAEVQVFAADENLAKAGKATQSTTDFGGPAERAIDGNTSGIYAENSTTHSAISTSPWWEVDLGKTSPIERIVVWNRTDGSTESRLAGAKIIVLSEDRKPIWETTISDPKASHSFDISTSISLPWLAAAADFSQDGFPASNAIDADAKTGWAVGGAIDKPHELNVAVRPDEWAKVLPVGMQSQSSKIRLTLKFESVHKQALLASFAVGLSTDDRLSKWLSIPANIAKILTADPSTITVSDAAVLHTYYVSTVAPSRQSMRQSRNALKAKLADYKPTTTVPILRDLPADKQRTTNIQVRGNYKVLGDKVSTGVLSAFHPYKPVDGRNATSNENMNRLDLARWLMQPDNPLAARVLANRYWESFFGVGIVRSSEEFGSQGDMPSNQELLDYLASELIRTGWDTKRVIRSILLSAAYRQQSAVTAIRSEEDPENVFVSHGPRFRVSAEQVRDMALHSAGLMSQRLYGPPTRPPQPSLGLSAAFGSRTDWDTSKGEDRFRRGIYTLWRRSSPYPSMATFDAPNREVCVLKRDRTNTPLQALVTLNDPAFVEAAQGLARRVVIHELPSGTTEDRIERLFRHALSRRSNAKETQSLVRLYNLTRDELSKAPESAAKLATDPLGPLPNNTDPIELATWTTICNVILNLDEFLMTP